MKKIFTILFLLASALAQAQQDPIYANYLTNPLLINPAYAGLNNQLSLNLNYRTQWTGFNEAPETGVVSAHSSFFNNQIGAGLMVVYDRIGVSTNTEINLSYSYKVQFGNGGRLSVGLLSGVQIYADDFNELNTGDNPDPAFLANESFTRGNFGAGLAYINDKIFVGVSIPKILEPEIDATEFNPTIFNRHYYVSAAYLIDVLYPIEFKPAVVYRGVANAPASVDYSVSAIYRESFQIGIFTRNFNTYGLQVQFNWKDNLRFGYTFEVPTSSNSIGSQFTTHEFSVQFNTAIFTFQGLERIVF